MELLERYNELDKLLMSDEVINGGLVSMLYMRNY